MKIIAQLIFLVLVFPSSLFAQGLFASPFVDDQARCFAYTDAVTPEQQQVINEVMGSVGHRQYHLLWHTTRANWTSFDATAQNAFRQNSSEWGRHAPLCPGPQDGGNTVAGEEFLLMHHLMIDQLRSQMVARGLPCIAAWSMIPQDNDPLWPVPADASDVSKGAVTRHLIDAWAEWFMSPQFLQGRSLSEVGYLLEFSIHNNLHMRWAAPSSQTGGFAEFANQGVFSLLSDNSFVDPRFNWLGHPYSSQVNPVFWKLHGWVDQVVERWALYNGYLSISFSCRPGDSTCYPWQSRWNGVSREPVGGSGHSHHSGGATPSTSLGSASRSVKSGGSFRNEAFENFLKEPRGGSVPGGPISMPEEDPAYYVRTWGQTCR